MCAGGKFPEDESEGVDVDPEVGLSLEADGSLQDLWRHVATGAHLRVRV